MIGLVFWMSVVNMGTVAGWTKVGNCGFVASFRVGEWGVGCMYIIVR